MPETSNIPSPANLSGVPVWSPTSSPRYPAPKPLSANMAPGSQNQENSIQTSLQTKHRDLLSIVLRTLTYLGAGLGFLVLASLVLYILLAGVPYLTASLFAWTYTTDNLSMMPAIVNTLLAILLTLAIALPIGVGTAIYLQEYAPKGSTLVKAVSVTAETLAGIPSIVYGLFGMLFFVYALHMGLSLLAGTLTLAIMVLPVILRTTQEALSEIPDSMREASLALGAGKLRTIFKILLPQAASGILSGILLATGRILGESAALIFTAGTIAKAAFNVMDPGATLSVHMYKLLNEGLYMDQAAAVSVVLLLLAALITLLQSALCHHLMKGDH